MSTPTSRRRRANRAMVCHVLREDAGLCEAVPPGLRERATEECIAAAVQIPRGRWERTGATCCPTESACSCSEAC